MLDQALREGRARTGQLRRIQLGQAVLAVH